MCIALSKDEHLQLHAEQLSAAVTLWRQVALQSNTESYHWSKSASDTIEQI